jgi:hypothetical protein
LTDTPLNVRRLGRSLRELFRRADLAGAARAFRISPKTLQQETGSSVRVRLVAQTEYVGGAPVIPSLKRFRQLADRIEQEEPYNAENARKALRVAEDAIGLVQAGYTPDEAGHSLKIDRGTLTGYVKGTRTPVALQKIGASLKARAEGFQLPREESILFAYLLGVRAACTNFGRTAIKRNTGVMRYSSDEETVADNIREAFVSVGLDDRSVKVGKNARKDRKAGVNVVQVICAGLDTQMDEANNSNRCIPSGFTITEAERRAFVRGFADMQLSIREGRVEMNKLNANPFLEEYSVLLHHIGIPSKVNKAGFISILGRDALVAFADKIYPESPDDPLNKALKRTYAPKRKTKGKPTRRDLILAEVERAKDTYSLREYDAVRSMGPTGASAKRMTLHQARAIGVALGERGIQIKPEVILRWIKSDSKPPSAARDEEIKELIERLPDQDIIGRLVRQEGLRPKHARDLEALMRALRDIPDQEQPLEEEMKSSLGRISKMGDTVKQRAIMAHRYLEIMRIRDPRIAETGRRVYTQLLAQQGDDEFEFTRLEPAPATRPPQTEPLSTQDAPADDGATLAGVFQGMDEGARRQLVYNTIMSLRRRGLDDLVVDISRLLFDTPQRNREGTLVHLCDGINETSTREDVSLHIIRLRENRH